MNKTLLGILLFLFSAVNLFIATVPTDTFSMDSYGAQFINVICQLGLVIAAFIALEQISITKQTTTQNSQREAARYATDLVEKYFDRGIALNSAVFKLEQEMSVQRFKDFEQLNLEDFQFEEIRNNNKAIEYIKYMDAFEKKDKSFSTASLDEKNFLESFATPFINKVANEDIAFRAMGRSFCASVESYWYDYCFYRRGKHGGVSFYDNTIKLYKLWKPKVEQRELLAKHDEILNRLSKLEKRG